MEIEIGRFHYYFSCFCRENGLIQFATYFDKEYAELSIYERNE